MGQSLLQEGARDRLGQNRAVLKSLTASRPGSRVLFWVGVAALIVRFLYFAEHATSPFFHFPILDEKFYDALGRTLADGGDVSRLNPGFRPWLYPFFLAGWFRLAGDWGYVLALCAQHLLGVATAVLVADLAMRLFRRPAAGALAGALYVLAGPPLFFEGELLITGLFTFLVTAQLWILSHSPINRADASASWPSGQKAESTARAYGPAPPLHGRMRFAHLPMARHAATWWFAAGAWTALAAQARPNMLLFLAAYPAAALVVHRGRRARRLALAGVALAGAFAVLAGFAVINERLTGRFQLTGGSGGVNFYLGNKLGADGMIPRQDRRVTYGDEYRDSVQVFAEELYREEVGSSDGPAAPEEVSRYWLGRTVEDLAADPSRWLALVGRKVLFLAWNHEIPNNKSYDFIRRHESKLLSYLPVRWWLLFSLALPGLLYAWGYGRRQLPFWIVAFLALHAAGVVLFFVNSRYRIPMWPAMAVLAAGGLLSLVETLKRRSLPDSAVALATVAGLAVISGVNWLWVEPPSFARDYFFRSLASLEKGHFEAARADARASVALDAVAPAARFHLGNVELALGDDDLAYRHFLVASYLSPGEPRILNNLGVVIERRNRPDLAYRNYLRALEVAGDYAPALVNAALLELRAGLFQRAERKLSHAEQLGLESVLLVCARALLERERGNSAAAKELLERARHADPETVDRLVEENRRRLVPRRLAETTAAGR